VRPLDIEGDFRGPAAVGGWVFRTTVLGYLGENRVRETELLVEGLEVRGDIGIVVSINDSDGLRVAIRGDRTVVKS
jgi:hypothetical protein